MDADLQTSTTQGATPPPLPNEDDYAKMTPEQRDALFDTPSEKVEPKTEEKVVTNGYAPAVEEKEPGEITLDGKPEAVRDAKGRFVPFEAYGKSKAKVKELETALTAEREERLKLTGRADELSKIIGLLPQAKKEEKAKAAEPEKAPDPEEDVLGALKFGLAEIGRLTKRMEEGTTKQKATEAHTQLIQGYEADAAKVLKEKPDLAEAYAHVQKAQRGIMNARGITDPATQATLLAKAEEDLVRDALSKGQSPTRQIYDMAVGAFGYVPKGAAQPAAAAGATKTEAERKLEAVKEGMAASGSLSTAAGGGGNAPIDLSKLTQAEFDQLHDKLSKTEWRRLMGE